LSLLVLLLLLFLLLSRSQPNHQTDQAGEGYQDLPERLVE
jgi:hypothetical protein